MPIYPSQTPGGGGGAVDSVNGATGVVVLDQDDVEDGEAYGRVVLDDLDGNRVKKLSDGSSTLTINDLDGEDIELNFETTTNYTFNQDLAVGSDVAWGAVSLNSQSFVTPQILQTGGTIADSPSLIYFVNTSPGGDAYTLPDPSLHVHTEFHFKDSDGSVNSTDIITINPFGAELIDGGASIILNTPYTSLSLLSDGTNWFTLKKPDATSGGNSFTGDVDITGGDVIFNDTEKGVVFSNGSSIREDGGVIAISNGTVEVTTDSSNFTINSNGSQVVFSELSTTFPIGTLIYTDGGDDSRIETTADGLIFTGYADGIDFTTTPILVNGDVGTAGQVLTSGGSGVNPTWETPSGSGAPTIYGAGDDTLTTADTLVIKTAITAGGDTMTLPTVTGNDGFSITIKLDNTNAIDALTISGDANIDGGADITVILPYGYVDLFVANGQWYTRGMDL